MKYILGFLFLFILSTACAQTPTRAPKQNNRQHRSGIPESQLKEAAESKVPMSMVRNVRQAKNGDILIASYVGVYRYDGTSFTNMTKEIEWPTFWDVWEDRKGNIWLASQDSGVYLQPAGQKGFALFKAKDGTGISSALSIYEERSGNLWFGATRYDGKTFRTFTTEDGFPTNNIRLLLEDKRGKLWFGAQGEDLFTYDRKTFTVLKNKDGQAFNNVWSVIEDRKGNIWFGANGLWRYDGKTFTKVSDRDAYSSTEDKDGNIWTTGGVKRSYWALSRYDQKTLYDKNPTVTEIMSLKQGALLGILRAKDGSIWFGAMGPEGKVYRYDGKTITDFRNNDHQQK